jgi:phosphohistidine phosphatase
MAAERQLIIMRHAKAGELPGGPDIERELRPRGRRNAESAGEWLAERDVSPDLVLCSKARRARQTWEHVNTWLRAKPEVIIDARLYDACARQLLGIFAETSAQVTSVMYVGHNPAAAEVTEILIAEAIAFPTAAIAVVGLAAPWPDLAGGDGELIASWTPRGQT